MSRPDTRTQVLLFFVLACGVAIAVSALFVGPFARPAVADQPVENHVVATRTVYGRGGREQSNILGTYTDPFEPVVTQFATDDGFVCFQQSAAGSYGPSIALSCTYLGANMPAWARR